MIQVGNTPTNPDLVQIFNPHPDEYLMDNDGTTILEDNDGEYLTD
jgi:hypothetical protein